LSGLRVLMTVDAVGGVWTYALDLARALRPLGIETVLAVLGPPPSDAQRDAAKGVRLIETGLALDWLAPDEGAARETARAVAALAEREGVDLVQINQPALAAEPMRVPVVAAMHSCVATWWAAVEQGPLPDAFAWQTALVRAGLARADAVVCPSAAFAEAVRATYRLPVAPRVVHNGRDVGGVPADGLAGHAFTAGRLWDRGKNLAVLDRAAAQHATPLLAAGPTEGPHGERVALTRIEALGTLGPTEIAQQLAQRPVFVSAAKYEPFGLAVLEAAQAECALVLSDIPTFRELWDGAATFVDADDADGFARAIDALIEEPAAREAQGAGARDRSARFTAEAMAGGMAEVVLATLARKAAA
jgi:glycosyltransferase involved in cell wall biosynthesis